MKIFINEQNLSSQSILDLAKDTKNYTKIIKILEKLNKYLIKKETINDIYSKEGIYQINENRTYKLSIKSEKIHENVTVNTNYGKNIILLIDDSVVEKELVYQIPYEHINIPLTIHTYSLNKNNNFGLVLVLEFIQKYKEYLQPVNYYFEYNSKIDFNVNNISIEDINVFLSLLN